MYRYLCLCCALICLNVRAEDGTSKHYFFSVCALFKNEAKYLKEWIEYHLLVGVDHFYLYDLGSTDHYMKVLTPYCEKKLVTLVRWHDYIGETNEGKPYLWALGTQIPAYENAARFRAEKETTWLTFLDINEFLVTPKTHTIKDMLIKYDTFPGVVLTCDYFDVDSKKHLLPKRKLLIETLELTKEPQKNIQKTVTKMVFKPDQCQGFLWPPYRFLFDEQQVATSAAKRELRINHYLNRTEGFLYTSRQKLQIDNRALSDEQLDQLLTLGYEIEDQDRAIYRHIPELLIRMGYDPTWGW